MRNANIESNTFQSLKNRHYSSEMVSEFGNGTPLQTECKILEKLIVRKLYDFNLSASFRFKFHS